MGAVDEDNNNAELCEVEKKCERGNDSRKVAGRVRLKHKLL